MQFPGGCRVKMERTQVRWRNSLPTFPLFSVFQLMPDWGLYKQNVLKNMSSGKFLTIYRFIHSFKNIFYWSIVDLQCCANFRHTAKWTSYAYTCIYFFKDSFPLLVMTQNWIEFHVLYGRSLLVKYFYIMFSCEVVSDSFATPQTVALSMGFSR